MRTWTRKEKYRTISPDDRYELQNLHERIAQSRWRSTFHVQPVTGLMNDPNGFSWFDGKWHLYYQWFPFGAVHGLKHWYHVESEDLAVWENKGLAMKPDILYDNYGCYSGSAFIEDGTMYFAYTGNNKDVFGQRHPYQVLAWIDEKGELQKLDHPLLTQPEGYTEHFRDPKLFTHNGKYYILVGAQDTQEHGKFLLYSSDQLKQGWKLEGELKVRGYDHFGFMVECPDIEKIGDDWLLLFSPQGLEAEGELYNNKYNNVYFVGRMDFENLEFVPNGPFRELDRGFDFYAAQCALQNQYENKAVLAGWFGVADYTYPATDEEEWSGLQTLARELTIEDGKLIQKPAKALKQLRGRKLFEARDGSIVSDSMHGLMPQTAIMRLDDPDSESIELNLFARSRKNGFAITYDKFRRRLVVERGDLENQCNEEFGSTRTVTLEDGLKSLEIYVDRSSVEVFVNDGEYVLSSRIFPTAGENLIRMGGKNIDLVIYEAVPAVEDSFVL
ncbi:MAG: sucrose-6-phosphate hydrolase [Erysipelotrichaceae bacterium]|nr:sucrose-6-phosphate hydrolase [Erysipelotrichaceae bacterium]